MASRDERRVAEFVEHLGVLYEAAGMPRIAARVLALLLADEDGRMTAEQIGTALSVSPAAVSAATTYLVHAGVTRKEREPGGRRTVHALLADDWYGIMLNRDKILGTTKALMHEGLQAVGGRGSHAGQRLWLSEELFAFLETEMAKVYLRWEDRKRELLG